MNLSNINIKRTVYTVVGFFFLVLGFLGLFLPILQGILFLLIGVSILATHNAYFGRLRNRAYRRFPRSAHFSERAKGRMRRGLRRFHVGLRSPGPLVYYISAHGYGHSVRSCDVIRALHRLRPELPLLIKSRTPAEFFDSRLKGIKYKLLWEEFDAGLVQIDSLRANLDESLHKAESLLQRRPKLIEAEELWLRDVGAAAVVADIPAIPFAAACRAGVPALGVANFSWDWIYDEFAARDRRWQAVAEAFAADYAQADLLFRLPFSGPMKAFPEQMDVGLLAEAGRDRRAEIAAASGADPGRRWVLICFWSLDWDSAARARIGGMEDCEFFMMPGAELGQANTHTLPRKAFHFSDVVASVDVVLSKPGYGILSDCIANGKPLIYSERSDFREYAVLVESIARYLPHARLSMEELYSGDFRRALDSLHEHAAPIPSFPLGGADEIATEICARIAARPQPQACSSSSRSSSG
jgi:hypothetical protein